MALHWGAILGTAALIVTAPVRAVCAGCYDEPYPSLTRFDAYLPYYTAPGPTAFREKPISYFAPAYPPTSAAPIIQPPISYSAPPQAGYRGTIIPEAWVGSRQAW